MAMIIENAPRGVWFLTLLRSRSPELIVESCGKRWSNRSACVPFPTPGAPTRIIRAALESLISIVGVQATFVDSDTRGRWSAILISGSLGPELESGAVVDTAGLVSLIFSTSEAPNARNL